MKIQDNRKLSSDLINQIHSTLKKNVYSYISEIEKSNYVKNVLAKSLENINELKPPQIENSEVYELWELTNKNLKEIFEQINETNYMKLLNLE